jgi:hypothetical protein
LSDSSRKPDARIFCLHAQLRKWGKGELYTIDMSWEEESMQPPRLISEQRRLLLTDQPEHGTIAGGVCDAVAKT